MSQEVITLAEKKEFIKEYVLAINARQPLTMSDVESRIALRTPVTSQRMEGVSGNGNEYSFWFTNMLDKPTWENYIVPAFSEFLQDEELIEGFETLDDLRDHMNKEFVNKCSVSINVFEDNESLDINEIGRGIEISGVPRTYEYDLDGEGTIINRIGLSISVIHKTERAKAGGKALTAGLLDLLSI